MVKLLGKIESKTELELLFTGYIKAGFPSPAGDFMGDTIDLNKELIKHPSATYYGKADGNSMNGAGIHDGDLLIIDRSIIPANDQIATCVVDGNFTCKRIWFDKKVCWLLPENPNFEPIKVTKENEFMIWGIVSHSITFHLKEVKKWWL